MKSFQLLFVFLLLVSGSCFSQSEGLGICGETKQEKFQLKGNDTIYTEPDIYPEFSGGRKAMVNYISENLPLHGRDCFYIEGKCYLQFIVDNEGNISNIKVLRGVPDCPECDREAISVVKGMPKWIPGKVNGRPVKSYYQMPVNFTIN